MCSVQSQSWFRGFLFLAIVGQSSRSNGGDVSVIWYNIYPGSVRVACKLLINTLFLGTSQMPACCPTIRSNWPVATSQPCANVEQGLEVASSALPRWVRILTLCVGLLQGTYLSYIEHCSSNQYALFCYVCTRAHLTSVDTCMWHLWSRDGALVISSLVGRRSLLAPIFTVYLSHLCLHVVCRKASFDP